MEGQCRLLELSIMSWMSAGEGCPLSGVPLYTQPDNLNKDMCTKNSVVPTRFFFSSLSLDFADRNMGGV